MALANYQDLQDAIQEWLVKQTDTTFTARTTDFIALCEAAMSGLLRVSELERRGRALAQNEYETVPTDFSQARTVNIVEDSGKMRNLDYRTPDQMSMFSQRFGSTLDVPRYYTIIGREIWFLPVPGLKADGSPHEYEWIYYARVPALTSAAPTNEILDRYPDIYLYGSLLHAADHIHDDVSMARFGDRFNSAVQTANAQGQKARYANTPAIGMPQ